MDEKSITNSVDPLVEESSEIKPQDQSNTQSNTPVESDPVVQHTPADEASRLVSLDTHVRDQDDLERDISRQADRVLLAQEEERDKKRLERTCQEKE